MYIFIVNKTKGDIGVSPILSLINKYINYIHNSKQNIFVVSFPGYMGTTINRIDDFYHSFPENIPRGGNQIGAYFFKGMNGGRALPLSNHPTCQQYINFLYGNYSGPTSFDDHSKASFFIELNKTCKKIDKSICNSKINAMLIGSSNQSYTSYIHSPANKGETDVFMVRSSIFNKDDNTAINFTKCINKEINSNNESKNNDPIILTKHIHGDIDFNEILKKMISYC